MYGVGVGVELQEHLFPHFLSLCSHFFTSEAQVGIFYLECDELLCGKKFSHIKKVLVSQESQAKVQDTEAV
jgi:hypothetical protein